MKSTNNTGNRILAFMSTYYQNCEKIQHLNPTLFMISPKWPNFHWSCLQNNVQTFSSSAAAFPNLLTKVACLEQGFQMTIPEILMMDIETLSTEFLSSFCIPFHQEEICLECQAFSTVAFQRSNVLLKSCFQCSNESKNWCCCC